MSHNPAGVPATSMAAFSPGDLWRIVRARLWLILLCCIVIGGGGTAAVVTWYFYAPSYTVVGIIEVEPATTQANPFGGQWENQMPISLYQQYVESQVLAVKKTRVLNAVLEQLKGEQTMFVGTGAVRELANSLQVSYITNTQNIAVSLRGRNKEQIQAIVREVLNQFVKQVDADRDEVDQKRQEGLTREQKDLGKQVERLAADLARYREEMSLVITDERSSEQMARLVALTHTLSDNQVSLAEASLAWNTFDQIRRDIENGKDTAQALLAFPEVLEALSRDPSIVAMTETVSRYSQELQGLQQQFGKDHPSVKRMDTALRAAQADLESKRALVLGAQFRQEEAVLKSRFDRLRGAESELLRNVNEARITAIEAAKKAADYKTREDEYHRVLSLQNVVTDGLARMGITNAMARPNVRVSNYPDIPLDPSEPRPLLYISLSWVLAILIGMGLSVLLEVVDTRVRSPADVVRQLGVPLLGTIPDLTEDERLSLDANLGIVGQESPHSLLAEAYRQCRTNLLFASDHPIKSLLVTSPNPGDGKSTVAANLAISMARSGSRVVLVEANFRRPAIAQMFDVPDTIGLSNVLVGLNGIDDAVQGTRIGNLDVLTSGPFPPSPAELLGSVNMRQLVQTLMQRYDQVVIDSAPMLVVADNYLLAEMVDGVIMVFHAGQSTRGMASRAARQTVMLRARLLGGVLNRVLATKGGYFREAFQTYYDYSGTDRPVDLVTSGARTGGIGSSEEGEPKV
jgi:polysaccharide biosynthesis transport protein